MEKNSLYFVTAKNIYQIDYKEKFPNNVGYIPPIPSPLPYQSLEDYKNDILEWKKEVKEKTKNYCFPLPASLFIQIPSTRMNDKIKLAKSAISERNLLFVNLIDMLINPQLNRIDEYNSKRAKKALLLSEQKAWGSSMYPYEPPPQTFPTYENYKDAMINWSNVEPALIQHPSDFIQTIGEIQSKNFFDEKENNTTFKPPKFETSERFDDFKNLKVENFNLLKYSLKQLFEDANDKKQRPAPQTNAANFLCNIVPSSVPFPVQPEQVLDSITNSYEMNQETILLTNISHCFKYILDPYNNELNISPGNIEEITLSADLSTNQMYAVLDLFENNKKYDSFLQQQLPFYIQQIPYIKSNRILNRIYVIIYHIIYFHPKMISLFYAGPLAISNITYLLSIFSSVQVLTYTIPPAYFPSMSRKYPNICNFLMFLLANQLTKQLNLFNNYYMKKEKKKRKMIREQISAQNNIFNIDSFIKGPSLPEIISFFSFQQNQQMSKKPKNPNVLHCLIFHLLCDFDKNGNIIAAISKNTPIFIFLGKVFLSKKCKDQFGPLCNHILRIPEISRLTVESLFNDQYQFSTANIIRSIIPTTQFLSSIIRLHSIEQMNFSPDKIFGLFLNTIQLASYNPTSSLRLLYSITKFCIAKFSKNQLSAADFKYVSDKIKVPISMLFQTPNLTPLNLQALYKIMNLLLLSVKSNVSSDDQFLYSYIDKNIFPRMEINSENSLESVFYSWEAFRNFILNPNVSFLKESPVIKNKVSDIIHDNNFPPSIQIQILLLEVCASQKKLKSLISKISKKTLINKSELSDRYDIPFVNPLIIFHQIIVLFENGELQEFKDEITVIIFAIKKWKRRTTSNV